MLLYWGFRPCQTLARIASDSRSSLERFLPLEFSPGSLYQFHLFAYYVSHCADDGRAGAGVCLFLSVGSQVHEVYRYQSFLGQQCTPSNAEFQGAYLALLTAFSRADEAWPSLGSLPTTAAEEEPPHRCRDSG